MPKITGTNKSYVPQLDFEDSSPTNKAADAEVASLYYQSSISSMAEKPPVPLADEAEKKVDNTQTKKSWFAKSKDWLWNLFGINNKQPTEVPIEEDDNSAEGIGNGIPVLEKPRESEQQRIARTLTELNQKFVHHMNDMAEFEEEMRKTGNDLDKLIFLQLLYSSLYQKSLKEEDSLSTQLDVTRLHKINKELQEKHYSLLDEINRNAKSTKVLHWTNVGLTAGIVALVATSFALGGPMGALGTGMALLSLGKGGTTLTGGILKKKGDHETGKLFMVNQEWKKNSNHIEDRMNSLQLHNDEIGELFKLIRRHLENHSRVERSFSAY